MLKNNIAINGHVKYVTRLILLIAFIVKTVYKHCITTIMSMLIYLLKKMSHIFTVMNLFNLKENPVGPPMILKEKKTLTISKMINHMKKHKNQV